MKDVLKDDKGNVLLSLPDNAVVLSIIPDKGHISIDMSNHPLGTTFWLQSVGGQQVTWCAPREPLPQRAQKGHIEAWRVWRWYRGLSSMLYKYQGSLSHLEAAHAQCFTAHEAPDESCACGYYAALNTEVLHLHDRNLGYEGVRVVGRVALWGKVIIGEKGYRAEYMYPLELWATSKNKKVQESLKEYGVPVHIIKSWSDL